MAQKTSGGGGIRSDGKTPEKPQIVEASGAESGAPAGGDADLAAVIDAWRMLPKPIRAGIVAMVRAAKG